MTCILASGSDDGEMGQGMLSQLFGGVQRFERAANRPAAKEIVALQLPVCRGGRGLGDVLLRHCDHPLLAHQTRCSGQISKKDWLSIRDARLALKPGGLRQAGFCQVGGWYYELPVLCFGTISSATDVGV